MGKPNKKISAPLGAKPIRYSTAGAWGCRDGIPRLHGGLINYTPGGAVRSSGPIPTIGSWAHKFCPMDKLGDMSPPRML